MTKAVFVKSARKAIYEKGMLVQYTSQKGKREGQTFTKVDRTIPQNESDKVFIDAGESYYWWQFKNSGKSLSKTRPKLSQLTQSNYLSQYYALQEEIQELSVLSINTQEDLQSTIEDLRDAFDTLKCECEESFDNIPENLQSSPNAELIQERIGNLEEIISELESIDTDLEEWESSDESTEEDESEYVSNWVNEKIGEIQNIGFY